MDLYLCSIIHCYTLGEFGKQIMYYWQTESSTHAILKDENSQE